MPDADNRVVMAGLDWERFEQLIEIRGIDERRPRFSYLDGAVELMSPSKDHEQISIRLNTLLCFYMAEADIEFEPVGSWLVKQRRKKAGVEPDQCFILRRPFHSEPHRPDLALEVVWTSGGLNKLEIYRRLGVPEVWSWIKGALSVHRLEGNAYARTETSALLPDLDLPWLVRLLELPTNEAIRAVRAAVAAQRG